MKLLDWREPTENNFDYNSEHIDAWKKIFGNVFTPRLCFELANLFFSPPESLLLDFDSKLDLNAALDAFLTDYEVKTSPLQIKLHITRWFTKQKGSTPPQDSKVEESEIQKPEKSTKMKFGKIETSTVEEESTKMKTRIQTKIESESETSDETSSEEETSDETSSEEDSDTSDETSSEEETKSEKSISKEKPKKIEPVVKQPEQKKINPPENEPSKYLNWDCSNCKFSNTPNLKVCSICQCPKPKFFKNTVTNNIPTKPVVQKSPEIIERNNSPDISSIKQFEQFRNLQRNMKIDSPAGAKKIKKEKKKFEIEHPKLVKIQTWICSDCDFCNILSSSICEICQNSRPKSFQPKEITVQQFSEIKQETPKKIQIEKKMDTKKPETKIIVQKVPEKNPVVVAPTPMKTTSNQPVVPKKEIIQKPNPETKVVPQKENNVGNEKKVEKRPREEVSKKMEPKTSSNWSCTNCKFSNVSNASECSVCQNPKSKISKLNEPKKMEKEIPKKTEPLNFNAPTEDWICSNCRKKNKAQKNICFFCLSPKQ
jgi:hypothetical protein